jgi:hypothetical protein
MEFEAVYDIDIGFCNESNRTPRCSCTRATATPSRSKCKLKKLKDYVPAG